MAEDKREKEDADADVLLKVCELCLFYYLLWVGNNIAECGQKGNRCVVKTIYRRTPTYTVTKYVFKEGVNTTLKKTIST